MYQIINTNVLLLGNAKHPDMLSVVQQHIQQRKQIKQPLPIDITSRQGTMISISFDLTVSKTQRNSDTSRGSDLGTEARNLNNWITVNHDIYGTRGSPQTIINRNNVATLQLKWRLINDAEIQDPPVIIGDKGYVQDYAGTVIAFDAKTGESLWKLRVGNGPTMGLTFNKGIIYASTAFNANVLAINATSGKIIWRSQVLGDPKVGYNILFQLFGEIT